MPEPLPQAAPLSKPSKRKRRSLLHSLERRLAERAKFDGWKSWLRFLRVQTTAKHRGGGTHSSPPVEVRLKGDPRPIYLRPGTSDGPVLKEIFLWDEYAPLLREVRGPVSTILDLGSNIGLTVRLWQRHFPAARVCAVEPDASNANLLERNAKAVPIPEAGMPMVLRVCVAGSSGFVTLDRSGAEWGISMRHGDTTAAAERVEAITVDELLRRFGHEQGDIDILKCDVEGAEAEIFAGECSWLSLVRHLAIEVHLPYDATRFLADVQRIAPGRFAVTHQVLGNPNSLLFLRRLDR